MTRDRAIGRRLLSGTLLLAIVGALLGVLGAAPASALVTCKWEGQTYNQLDLIILSDGTVMQCRNVQGVAKWVKVMDPITNDYRHLASTSNGLCIGVGGGSQADLAPIVQGGCVNGDHSQAWAQEPIYGAGDYGILINWHSGKCITVNASNFLIQTTCNGNWDRLWRKVNINGSWMFQNYQTSQVLTIPGGSAQGGVQLEVYPDRGYPFQRWSILPLV